MCAAGGNYTVICPLISVTDKLTGGTACRAAKAMEHKKQSATLLYSGTDRVADFMKT